MIACKLLTLCASLALPICSLVYPTPSIASSHVHICPNAYISVIARETVDHLEVCRGAEDALRFFEQLNLEPSNPLAVEIVPDLPNVVGRTAVGCYLQEDERILVLTFSAFEKRKDWFGVPVDRSMYRSLVTHEVAHAIADCNFAIPDPTIQAQEYVAYIAMFAMMSPDLRGRILDENPGTGFDSVLAINALVYMFDPMRFGIEAYRHYLKKEYGNGFLRNVLSGKALNDSEPRLPCLELNGVLRGCGDQGAGVG